MAILTSHGILLVNEIPTHTPTADQAKLARLLDTFTFYYYNGTAWLTLRLDTPETFTGNIIPNNATLGQALQALEDAIETINQDGNHTPISRNNAIENVEPTASEVPSPLNGDTADINLTSGKLEKWFYNGSTWGKAFTLDYKDVTNLGYTPATSSGAVTSSSGTNATLPAVGGANAGLMLPAHKVKLDLITVTQNINLNTLFILANSALQTVVNSNSIDLIKTGTQISANLKISATQNGATVTVENDGLRVSVDEEIKPSGYLSKTAATTALGANKKFRYLAANLDGAVEGTIAWT